MQANVLNENRNKRMSSSAFRWNTVRDGGRSGRETVATQNFHVKQKILFLLVFCIVPLYSLLKNV